MNEDRPFFSHLKCRECGRLYEKEAIHICEYDFGPLEAAYDYEVIRGSISRKIFAGRPQSMWRYRELLPIDGEPTVGVDVGFTPLVKATVWQRRWARRKFTSRTIPSTTPPSLSRTGSFRWP